MKKAKQALNAVITAVFSGILSLRLALLITLYLNPAQHGVAESTLFFTDLSDGAIY